MKTKIHKYKLNAGSLIWREFDGWKFIPKKNKNKTDMDEKECILIQEFIKEILRDILSSLNRNNPFSSDFNDKLFQKTIKRLFKPYRAKLIKHKYEGKLPGRVVNVLTESEMEDINTRLYSLNFIWAERIIHDKKGLDMVADELSYMLRSTDKENEYKFEAYGVYYEAHGPKSIKEKEKIITIE